MNAIPSLFPDISLSAWNYTQAPALVSRLESAFVRSLSEGIATTRSVSEETRSGLSQLLKKGASPHLLGDALYLGQMMEWVDRRNGQLGAGTVQVRFQGPEKLFDPFENEGAPPSGKGPTRKKKEFLAGFERLDPIARALPEIEGPAFAFFRYGDELLVGGGYRDYLSPLLRPQGVHVFNHDENFDLAWDSPVIFRHLSFSALEMGLRVFVGDASARFCRAPGLITERQSNDLHKMGYHVAGIPLGSRIIHSSWQRAPLCALHDASHAAQWSLRVPPWMRIAAALLLESVRKVAPKERRTMPVWSICNGLGDLELENPKANLRTALKKLKNALPSGVYRKILEDWSVRLDDALVLLRAEGVENAPLSRLADSVRSEV